jgi:epoxyqueuosine reductase QueG
MKRIIDIIVECGAAEAALIKYSDCEIINPKLIGRLDFIPKSVIIATVPYYTAFCEEPKTVSSYALAYDYHIYLKTIAEAAIEKAKILFPEASFKFFADHSPINEKISAAKAGLGIIGEHSLLITEKHSSFVFLFEIFTDIECSVTPKEVMHCEKCNKCVEVCPTSLNDKSLCLSAITQKKGDLTETEVKLISRSKCAWGCDICQTSCPHTLSAIKSGNIYTNSEWFNSNICTNPSESTVLNDEDFKKRAYSWRGKDTILRNIRIIEGNKK